MPDDARRTGATLSLDRFIPYRLSILSNTVSGAIARLYADRFGLGVPEWRIMAILGERAPLNANEICVLARMDKVQVSRAVARLIEAGRLARETDPGDRRRANLRLTRDGEAVYREIVPLALAAESRLLESLSAPDLEALDRLMVALQAAADRLDLPSCGVQVPSR